MTTRTLNGSCLCGKVTYALDLPATEPLPKIALCHCISCKKYTGSPFSTNIMVPISSITYTSAAKPTTFMDNSTDSGVLLPRDMCGTCGTHFTSTPGGIGGTVTALKWGTLDDEGREACSEMGGEIYCKRRDGWVDGIGAVRGGEWVKEEGMFGGGK
ncbi:Mss4-like protein [Aspergillus venezuelensis]